MPEEKLIVRGAREHNLRNIDVTIPRDRLTVITGLSGSGKSSLAFDTIYAEGQRRYVESLSAYARQFLGLMEKPDVDAIEGLSPAISIEQKIGRPQPAVDRWHGHRNLRLPAPALRARRYAALSRRAASPCSGRAPRRSPTPCSTWPEGTRIEVLAPLVRGRKGEFKDLFEMARKQGFVRAVVDGKPVELASPPKLSKQHNHSISVIVDRLVARAEDRGTAHRLARDGASPRRWHRRRAAPRHRRDAALLRALRLPDLRALAPRARAAPVLVQLSVRRLRALRRTRRAERSLRRAHPRRRERLDSRGRHSPVGRAERTSAQDDSPGAGEAVQVRPQRTVGNAHAEDARS